MSGFIGVLATLTSGVEVIADVTSSSATSVASTSFLPTTFSGVTVLRAETSCGPPGCWDFRLELNTQPLGQAFFKELLVQQSAGGFRILRTSDAVYENVTTGTPRSRWTWGDFSSPVWVTASAPVGTDLTLVLRKT